MRRLSYISRCPVCGKPIAEAFAVYDGKFDEAIFGKVGQRSKLCELGIYLHFKNNDVEKLALVFKGQQ